jgi:hypothetical protein
VGLSQYRNAERMSDMLQLVVRYRRFNIFQDSELLPKPPVQAY